MIWIGELHLHFHGALDAPDLQPLIERLDAIMTTQAEVTAALTAATQKLDAALSTLTKVSGETGALLVEIQTLKDLIASMGNTVSPELAAAVEAVASKAQAVADAATGIDGQVPDEPEAQG